MIDVFITEGISAQMPNSSMEYFPKVISMQCSSTRHLPFFWLLLMANIKPAKQDII
jgi:hypothetical protein